MPRARLEAMERLRNIRKSKDLTIRDLAKASGVATSTISTVENGQRKPQPHTLEALAGALETDIEELKKPMPAIATPTPTSARGRKEFYYATLENEVWPMLHDLPEEVLERLTTRINLELSDRWWKRQTILEAQAYGLTPQEYDKRIADLFEKYKAEGGGSNEEWSAYFEKHWPWPLNLEEARKERAASE
jgi:transcriptional regulator with XRE-family HTH domain